MAETEILPNTNGSARVCFSDGTEAIVGVKVELEKSARNVFTDVKEQGHQRQDSTAGNDSNDDEELDRDGDKLSQPTGAQARKQSRGSDSWLEMSIDIPGFRDDDALPVFLSSMLREALLASGELRDRLWINENWHWKLYIDVLLLSAPLSYPLPLLSLTTYLALFNTALPRQTSDPDDDPLFDDDWAAAVPLYPRSEGVGKHFARPPITLLVITVGENVICDPSKEELAVAENVLALSLVPRQDSSSTQAIGMKLVSMRTVDPPSRLTPLGVPNSANPAAFSGSGTDSQVSNSGQEAIKARDMGTVWSPPRGGIKRILLSKVIKMVVEAGGPGEQVIAGLAAVET